MTTVDPWATLFADALINSHHRDWSETMITEAALVCADVARRVMASYAVERAALMAAIKQTADGAGAEIGYEGYL